VLEESSRLLGLEQGDWPQFLIWDVKMDCKARDGVLDGHKTPNYNWINYANETAFELRSRTPFELDVLLPTFECIPTSSESQNHMWP
jgi:hypothetical protein